MNLWLDVKEYIKKKVEKANYYCKISNVNLKLIDIDEEIFSNIFTEDKDFNIITDLVKTEEDFNKFVDEYGAAYVLNKVMNLDFAEKYDLSNYKVFFKLFVISLVYDVFDKLVFEIARDDISIEEYYFPLNLRTVLKIVDKI